MRELPVDLTPRLAGCNLLTGYLAEAQGPEAQRVAYALSRVRNDLAHGNKGFDAYDLNETVRVLERIVRAHALRLLGVGSQSLSAYAIWNRTDVLTMADMASSLSGHTEGARDAAAEQVRIVPPGTRFEFSATRCRDRP